VRTWIQTASRLTRNREGNAMVEFALGAAVLLATFTGTFQFGYTFLQYNNLENAVARGARYASLAPYDSRSTTPSDAFKTAVQNMVLYGSPTAGTTPVLSGLTNSNINLTVTFTNEIPSQMTVSISGYTVNAIFSLTTFNMKPQITYSYQGIWTPI
jgi:Flp pilus assembly protein TadG